MVPTKADNASVPVTPLEIADDAEHVVGAGASIVHVHARDAEVSRCDRLRLDERAQVHRFEERSAVLDLDGDEKPELASLTLGCFAARTADGRVVSVRWAARRTARIEFLDCALPLAPDEAYNFDTWTDPPVRGLGVAAATGARLDDVLAAEGVRTVLRAVWPANQQGLRNAAGEGFAPVGSITAVRVGPFRRRIVRRTA
jgi:hypothetical protein